MSPHLPLLIVIIPLMASLAVLVMGWWVERAVFILAITALSLSFGGAVWLFNIILDQGVLSYHLGGWIPPFGIEYRIDRFNSLMLVLISFLGWITAIWANKSVEKELPRRGVLFWCLYLLLMTGLLGILVTADLFNLFVLLEVASLTGYALVAAGGRQAALAGMRYLIIGTIGACFYLLGVGYLYLAAGTLNMAHLAQLLPPLYGSKIVVTAFVFIFTGFSIKIALFPLHAWQPDAYTHAPSAVSIIISTAMAKTFAYAMIRVIFSVFTLQFLGTVQFLVHLICVLAAAAIILGSIFAIVQDNLKQILAYSSIANVGYIVLGVGFGVSSSLGLTPAVIHMVNHAVIKGAMFMAACGIVHKLNLIRISGFIGLSQKMPISVLTLILASLAMIGLPPGGGFVSKWVLILAAIDGGHYLFVAVIFISTLLMLVYFWRIIETMYIRPSNEPLGPANAPGPGGELPLSMVVPMVAMAVFSFVIGLVWMSGGAALFLNGINQDLGVLP